MTEPSNRGGEPPWRDVDPVALAGGCLALALSAFVLLGLVEHLVWLLGATIVAVGVLLLVLSLRPRRG
ncbi:hypothetical protein [Salinifilum ghardaiensis]